MIDEQVGEEDDDLTSLSWLVQNKNLLKGMYDILAGCFNSHATWSFAPILLIMVAQFSPTFARLAHFTDFG